MLALGDEHLDREELTGIAVSPGRRSRARKALIRAGAGIAVGVSPGFIGGDDSGSFLSFSAEQKATGLGVALGAIGGVIGLALSPGERWEEVPLDDVRLTFGPVPGPGPGVFLTFAF